MFKEYTHVEKVGSQETDGIELGEVYAFPKIDGSQTSIWFEDGTMCFGKRHSQLVGGDSLNGFPQSILENESLFSSLLLFFGAHPHWRLYGEWLTPHSLKTYRKDAWRRFYIYDVYNDDADCFIHYEAYSKVLKELGLEFIPPLRILVNPSLEQMQNCINDNVYLIEDGNGIGEGVVFKNYSFVNRYGRTTWAKIVTNEFKEKLHKEMGAPKVNGEKQIEIEAVNEFLTLPLIDKVYANIVAQNDGWSSKFIPQLLGIVYYDFVREETWNVVKKFKNPKIDYKVLAKCVNNKIKELKPELF